jgi:hypothetical protein
MLAALNLSSNAFARQVAEKIRLGIHIIHPPRIEMKNMGHH